ncbi:MAG: peptidylprolyl isomerase [Akkermansiaceae bacterium]|nr:peptidylprolyl isomerase [Akkermansiaceae bacterium]
MRSLLPFLGSGLGFLLATSSAPAQVFADFETKSGEAEFGRFTVMFDHYLAPYATANFIRLAEGLRPWIDPGSDGEVKTGPFFDGLTFHSTTPNFEIAAGSPSGNGRDGPGYQFRDDFRSAPTRFSVYMENDGPNSNGSRFFISLTAGPNPVLRPGNYSRFGEVTQLNNLGGNGRATVFNISNSPSGFITIASVKMRYVGEAAQGFRFSVEDPLHPVLSRHPSSRRATAFHFRKLPGQVLLDWDDAPGSVLSLWGSSDLHSWLGPLTAMNVPGSTQFGFDLTPSIQLSPTGFFRGGITDYPEWPATDRPLPDSFIQTSFFDPAIGSFTTTYLFDESGAAGTYSSSLGTGQFTVADSRILGPYKRSLDLTPTSGAQPAYRFTLHHDLAWTDPNPLFALPVTAHSSRLEGANLADPGTPLVGGQWTYTGP